MLIDCFRRISLLASGWIIFSPYEQVYDTFLFLSFGCAYYIFCEEVYTLYFLWVHTHHFLLSIYFIFYESVCTTFFWSIYFIFERIYTMIFWGSIYFILYESVYTTCFLGSIYFILQESISNNIFRKYILLLESRHDIFHEEVYTASFTRSIYYIT